MAHPRHDLVRARYEGRCGYCGVGEVDAGGELTVDHYVPASAGGDDSDDNLIYCCVRCNLYKSDFTPDARQTAAGLRVLHPVRDRVADHVALEETTGLLIPKTETGRFHLALLHLNRPALVAHRRRAAEVRNRETTFRALEQQVAILQTTVFILLQMTEGLRLLQPRGPEQGEE